MKKFILCFLPGILLLLSLTVHAQATDAAAPVGYAEQVQATGTGRRVLYQRALSWTDKGFTYTSKTAVKADAAAGTLRLQGTGQVKVLGNNNKIVELPVQFEFIFRATDNGYDYSVSSFTVAPDAGHPATTVAIDAYLAQLTADRNNSRTNNDRRVRAQATSLASEVALSFRSYMNSRENEGDDSVGLE